MEKMTTQVITSKIQGYVASKLKNADIYNDCFHQILSRLNTKFLYQHFGINFMQSDVWLGDWINKIKLEAKASYLRESFMMSFYFASKNLYGLAERSSNY
jgi:hypothetical protein